MGGGGAEGVGQQAERQYMHLEAYSVSDSVEGAWLEQSGGHVYQAEPQYDLEVPGSLGSFPYCCDRAPKKNNLGERQACALREFTASW